MHNISTYPLSYAEFLKLKKPVQLACVVNLVLKEFPHFNPASSAYIYKNSRSKSNAIFPSFYFFKFYFFFSINTLLDCIDMLIKLTV